jgi:hypothetical protein
LVKDEIKLILDSDSEVIEENSGKTDEEEDNMTEQASVLPH